MQSAGKAVLSAVGPFGMALESAGVWFRRFWGPPAGPHKPDAETSTRTEVKGSFPRLQRVGRECGARVGGQDQGSRSCLEILPR